jgi:hypothetical protein
MQTNAFLGRTYYPQTVADADGLGGFQLGTDVLRLGPLTVGQFDFDFGVALFNPDMSGYHLTLPVRGGVRIEHRRVEVVASPSSEWSAKTAADRRA